MVDIDGVEETLSQSPERAARPSREAEPDPVKVRIPEAADEEESLAALREIFNRYRGNAPVLISLQNGKIVKTGQGGGVHPTIDFFDTVAEVVGRPNVKGRPSF